MGGRGADRFELLDAEISLRVTDQIMDFDAQEGDRLVLPAAVQPYARFLDLPFGSGFFVEPGWPGVGSYSAQVHGASAAELQSAVIWA